MIEPVDWVKIRTDFPLLSRKIHGKPLVYLDNAASAQKPTVLMDSVQDLYSRYYANIHRGVHTLSQESTAAYEEARKKIAAFIGAENSDSVIFTGGTTAGLNLLAHSIGQKWIHSGDEIVLTRMEHHANIVPWQMLSERSGAVIRPANLLPDGRIDENHFFSLIGEKTRIISLTWVSNALGTVNPLEAWIPRLRKMTDAIIIVDAAQAVPHMPVSVEKLNADFLVFSAHKVMGPTGLGILWGRYELLDALPPFMGGGDMIDRVSFEGTTYNKVPFRFEAGTPDIAAAIGFAAVLDYLQGIGMEHIEAREQELLKIATDALLAEIPGIQIYGTAPHKAAVISFLVKNIHPYDLGVLLDHQGVALRTGHHCAQPLMDFYNIPGTARASLAFYNNEEDIRIFVNALKRAVKMLS